jgi:hypothetical protein
MKIEKHNAHGMQLVVTLSLSEAAQLLEKLARTLRLAGDTNVNHYVDIPCKFEDDNDQWVDTDFTVMVEGDPMMSEEAGCQPAFPCGKPVEQQGSIPAGPCDRQEGHDLFCCRHNARPDYRTPVFVSKCRYCGVTKGAPNERPECPYPLARDYQHVWYKAALA